MLTYDVSSSAVLQAIDLGLGEEPEPLVNLLALFARRSAIVTHPQGTRRFGDYVLDVKDARIYGIYRLQPNGHSCPDCYGTRAHYQHERGHWIEIPCQTCKEG